MKLRALVAATAVALGSLLGAMPASAATSEVASLAKKFTRSGFDCTVKKPINGYREANCAKGAVMANIVAYSNASNYSLWLPTYCDVIRITGFSRYLTNGTTWVVGSPDLPQRELRKIVGQGGTRKC